MNIITDIVNIIIYIIIILFLLLFIFVISVLTCCEIFDNTLDKFYITDKLEDFENSKTDPIDVVYTWVNSYDTDWISQKEKELEKIMEKKKIDVSKKRWINTNQPHEEISLSIESVRTYLPWVRNIFVVTQRPQQLPESITSLFNVIHIHHDQIFKDKNVLPVFSSQSIEATIHRIPGLSEKFIYFNDDMYINRPMKRSDFFIDDLPIFRYYKIYAFYINHLSKLIKSDEKHLNSIIYCKHLLEHKNIKYCLPCIHHATPITKQILYDTENMFQKDWNRTISTKFRSENSIVPIYLSLSLAFYNNKVVMIKNDKIKHTLLYTYIHAPIFHNQKHLLCINSIKPNDMNLLRKQILHFTQNKKIFSQINTCHTKI